ncbi:hypothetical protein NAEX_03581 [Nannocystis exedens]|nr:hypothetical protein NAEX_03581 [Nannocystis exedens]
MQATRQLDPRPRPRAARQVAMALSLLPALFM